MPDTARNFEGAVVCSSRFDVKNLGVLAWKAKCMAGSSDHFLYYSLQKKKKHCRCWLVRSFLWSKFTTLSFAKIFVQNKLFRKYFCFSDF